MSAPQTARERFEAWWLNCPEWWPASTDSAWAAWQAAERSAIERAAKILKDRAEGFRSRATTIYNGRIVADELDANVQAIRNLIT